MQERRGPGALPKGLLRLPGWRGEGLGYTRLPGAHRPTNLSVLETHLPAEKCVSKPSKRFLLGALFFQVNALPWSDPTSPDTWVGPTPEQNSQNRTESTRINSPSTLFPYPRLPLHLF
jgi:hypothetical protein